METDLHLNMAYLLNNASVKTHEIILSVMNTLADIQKKINEDELKKKRIRKTKRKLTWETNIPENINDSRRMYTLGTNSIVNNIPIPNVELLQDNKHSYISLKEIVADINGYGTDIERIIGGRVGVPSSFNFLNDSEVHLRKNCWISQKLE